MVKHLFMLRVTLYHEDCWTAEIMNIFPDRNPVIPVSRSRSNGVTITHTFIRASIPQIKNLVNNVKFYKFSPSILGAFEGTKQNKVYLVSFKFKSRNSIYRKLEEIESTIPFEVIYKDDLEIWDFFIPSGNASESYKNLILGKLEKVADIKKWAFEDLYQVPKVNIENYLKLILPLGTKSMLNKLMNIGFFDFPRKLSIDNAATQLGVSKGYISKVSRKIFDILKSDY